MAVENLTLNPKKKSQEAVENLRMVDILDFLTPNQAKIVRKAKATTGLTSFYNQTLHRTSQVSMKTLKRIHIRHNPRFFYSANKEDTCH